MDKDTLMDSIRELSDRDLKIIENVVRALTEMKSNRYPFLGNFLNIREEPQSELGVFACSMPITREILNPYRIVYGGATATLADMAMAWMLEGLLPPGDRFVTIDMQVNYHNPGIGKKLIAKARVIKQAQQIWQMACTIHNDKGDLIVTSSGTFLQLERKQHHNSDNA
ncbi:MAG TPA: PaaI family thioesterase [Bacillota bacterium]|nr:PaaI family thioesterase [Bacillota bacterium]